MVKDFSKYKSNNKYYSGSERKIGITIGENNYIVKFQKKDELDKRFNHVSEYIGSQIFSILGFNVQETYLGTYNGEQVVVIKDFNEPGSFFVPFNEVGESSLEEDKETYQYSYEDIIKMLEENKKLTKVEKTISTFWEMYIVDALIANFDRHGSNWGFMKKNNEYTLAPVFDNGACLFPKLIDENRMQQIMEDEESLNERIYTFPTSQIKLNGEKSSYYYVISSLKYEECNNALINIIKRCDLQKIYLIIDEIEIITDVRKAFYKKMIKERYEKILMFSYNKLIGSDKDE